MTRGLAALIVVAAAAGVITWVVFKMTWLWVDVRRLRAERARVSRPAAPRGLTTIDIQDRLRSRPDDNNTPGGTA